MDPRICRTREVVLDATLDELADSGYDGMTVEAIARRAGVSKATVYRHWEGKEELVCDALDRSREAVAPLPEGSARERIVAVLQQLASKYRDGVTTRCMPALISASDRNPAIRAMYHDFVAAGRSMLAELIADGVADGEFAPVHDVDLAAGALVGPVIVARFFTDVPFDPERAAEHVDWVLTPATDREPGPTVPSRQ